MSSYLFNAPAGVPGDVTRYGVSLVDSVVLGAAFSAFGLPFKYNGSGQAIPIAASDTAAVFKGIITRSVPSISGNMNQGLNDAIPNQESVQGALLKGYCNVLCKVGTPVKGGIVYMRVVADTGKLVGDFEATSDGTNSVALPGVEWAVGGKDATNIAEIFIK